MTLIKKVFNGNQNTENAFIKLPLTLSEKFYK